MKSSNTETSSRCTGARRPSWAPAFLTGLLLSGALMTLVVPQEAWGGKESLKEYLTKETNSTKPVDFSDLKTKDWQKRLSDPCENLAGVSTGSISKTIESLRNNLENDENNKLKNVLKNVLKKGIRKTLPYMKSGNTKNIDEYIELLNVYFNQFLLMDSSVQFDQVGESDFFLALYKAIQKPHTEKITIFMNMLTPDTPISSNLITQIDDLLGNPVHKNNKSLNGQSKVQTVAAGINVARNRRAVTTTTPDHVTKTDSYSMSSNNSLEFKSSKENLTAINQERTVIANTPNKENPKGASLPDAQKLQNLVLVANTQQQVADVVQRVALKAKQAQEALQKPEGAVDALTKLVDLNGTLDQVPLERVQQILAPMSTLYSCSNIMTLLPFNTLWNNPTPTTTDQKNNLDTTIAQKGLTLPAILALLKHHAITGATSVGTCVAALIEHKSDETLKTSNLPPNKTLYALYAEALTAQVSPQTTTEQIITGKQFKNMDTTKKQAFQNALTEALNAKNALLTAQKNH